MFLELKTPKETLFVNLDMVVLARELPKGLDDGVEISYMSGKSYFLTREQWDLLKPHLLAEETELQAALSTAIREGVELARQLRDAQGRIEELEFQAGKTWWYIDAEGIPRCRNCNAETVYDLCGVRTLSGKYPLPADAPPTTEFQQVLKADAQEAIQRADMVVAGEAGLYRKTAENVKPDDEGGHVKPGSGFVSGFRTGEHTHQVAPAPASDPSDSRVEYAWRVTRVTRKTFESKTSGSTRTMWALFSVTGTQVNLFDHADPLRDHKPLLDAAGYLDLFQAMEKGDTSYWNKHPIEITVTPSGKFWDIVGIKPRDPDAVQDEPTGDLNPEQTAVCREAKGMLERDDLVVFDVETTGLNDDDEIVEIAGVLIDPQHPAPAFQSFVKPTNISLLRRPGKNKMSAFDIHGIDETMLADAPRLDNADLLNLLSEYMDKKAWAAFNIDFDERLLYQGMDAVGDNSGFPEARATYCVQKMMNRYLGHEYTSLNQACRTLNITRSTKHRAAADAEDTLKVLRALAAKVPAEKSIQPDPF